MTPVFGPIGAVVLYAIALFTVRLAIRTARSPQGATGWVVFLLSFPLLAVPAYAVFGGLYRINRRHAPDLPARIHGSPPMENTRLSDLQDAVGAKLTQGNDLSLLVDGEETFTAIFDAIDAAESEVLIQFYTLMDDALGQRLKSHLIAARRRGVSVFVLVDALGSLMLSRPFIRSLRSEGIVFRGNFTLNRTLFRLGVNFRDHRKMVIVDGTTGFTGGLNAAQIYVDGGESFDKWRDTFVRARGPVVRQMRDSYASAWRAIASEDLPELDAATEAPGDMCAAHVSLGPTSEGDIGTLLVLGLICKARDRLWITTPYLVPPPEVGAALRLAAQRGLDVRLLVPYPVDKYLPWLASRAFFADLHAQGVAIYEFKPGFMHQKVMLVDDDIASVGTINLDFRSITLNFEQTVLIEDRGFCTRIADMLESDFANSRCFDGEQQSLFVRVFAPVAQLLSPVL